MESLIGMTSTTYTVADFCRMLSRKEITVNRDYQRSDRVWPPAAKSFLIETILLGFPIPKLSLYQVTDIKSRQTRKEIVDGQQRSHSIFEFFEDRLTLSKSLEFEDAAGRRYSELDESLQHRFLDYAIGIDLFTAATPDQIREVFRRMNSYTVPLNPEEQRHAVFQGDFKWFAYELSHTFDQILLDIGTFTEKSLIRMADAKLFTEIVHALLSGISTTSKAKLDGVYRTFDKDFPHRKEFRERIQEAVDFVLLLPEIHKGTLVKPFMMYSLLLAITHVKSPSASLQELHVPPKRYKFDRDVVLTNLTSLAEAVDDNDEESRFGEFVQASSSRTNVKAQREIRFKWFCEALEPSLL